VHITYIIQAIDRWDPLMRYILLVGAVSAAAEKAGEPIERRATDAKTTDVVGSFPPSLHRPPLLEIRGQPISCR
jgi:hypothetical protein